MRLRTRPNRAAIEALRQVDLFRGCSSVELARFRSLMTPVEFEAGRVLTQLDEIGRELFLITSGSAAVSRGDEVVRHVGAGSFFGEMALLDGGRRSATVVVDTAMEGFVLSQQEFQQLLLESPRVARNLLRAMSRRLRAA